MANPTGALPNPPDDEETGAILEDFKGLIRTLVGTEYAKELLFPELPGRGVIFKNIVSQSAWCLYWLGRRGVGGVVDAEIYNPVTAEGKVAAITHNIQQLLIDASEHTGESTGNLDVQKQAIEDQVRALVGLLPLQPELGITDGWLGDYAERAAIVTLRSMGFTYHGGSRWKPPLGTIQRAEFMNGLIRRMKAKPGRYCISSVPLLAHGALYFVEVDAEGTVHQLTIEGERDGQVRDGGWRGDEFALDPRLVEEFPGGAPVFGGDQRAHVVCLCPDCTKPAPRPAVPPKSELVTHCPWCAAPVSVADEPYCANADCRWNNGGTAPAEKVKCDGDHGGPACADPECWSRE
jgi:hypothetical protein